MAVFPMFCVHQIKLYNQSAFKDIHFARAISIEYKQISIDLHTKQTLIQMQKIKT